MLPWVNKKHPENVSHFKIPTSFDSLDIYNFKLSVHDYFVSMSMDPVFKLDGFTSRLLMLVQQHSFVNSFTAPSKYLSLV